MNNSNKSKYDSTTKIYGISSIWGMGRAFVGFPIEQPLEAIKTQWQTKPGYKNEYRMAVSIY